MATSSLDALPLVVIVGPTASGKTDLAIRLAERFGGEIICADSRTVYRGMDIGTAKPSAEEQERVPHWGIDLVNPGEKFSAADFQSYARTKIDKIRARGKVPFLVGGSGLYVDAVIFDYTFGPLTDETQRQKLQQMALSDLIDYCQKNNIKLPENKNNTRYIIRAIERSNTEIKRRDEPIDDCIIVGITTYRHILRTRIERRAEQLFLNNVVAEAITLGRLYGWDSEAMTGNIYPIVREYIQGHIDEEELRRQSVVSDWRLAKRQLTWLRRNEYICWADLSAAEHYLSRALAATPAL